ncbi:thioredoxin family protein [Oceanimonas sp. MB9]|uniref:TlpA family protein disulfide reductase n=1 Tax=Oceanimonas sp. MB9 TaxID=2588453 RepID=UPI0013F5A6DC|nr:redoxin family protein [Oceanimonas sp. MB9]NHI01562.1 Sporulation thiol-disulfide oxidoreductase A [Oceanimonas sp. MB9]
MIITLARLCLALCLTLSLSAWSQESHYRTIELTDFATGTPTRLAELDHAKPTYIKFWATWCQPCMQQMPHFQLLQDTFGDRINFVAVNININERSGRVSSVIDRFGLTMPVWMDQRGQLALELGLEGTPYSVLINPAGKIVYTTHESDAMLDGVMARLADGQSLSSAGTETLGEKQKARLLAPWQQGEHLVFFSATWCDWYLEEARPGMARRCKDVQQGLNELVKQLPEEPWQGVVNHLWTDDKALSEFVEKYQMTIPFHIDRHGVLFNEFGVRDLPVLLKLRDGKVIATVTDFSSVAAVRARLGEAR